MAEVRTLHPEPANEALPMEHASGAARCIACNHEWVAVVGRTQDTGYAGDLECPACHCHRGQMIWPFTGPAAEEVWTCTDCDSVVFMITRPGTRCVGCGRHQVFPDDA